MNHFLRPPPAASLLESIRLLHHLSVHTKAKARSTKLTAPSCRTPAAALRAISFDPRKVYPKIYKEIIKMPLWEAKNPYELFMKELLHIYFAATNLERRRPKIVGLFEYEKRDRNKKTIVTGSACGREEITRIRAHETSHSVGLFAVRWDRRFWRDLSSLRRSNLPRHPPRPIP